MQGKVSIRSKSPDRGQRHRLAQPPGREGLAGGLTQLQRARIKGGVAQPADLLALQHASGNQAVVQLLSRSLVGRSVARGTPPAQTITPIQQTGITRLQRRSKDFPTAEELSREAEAGFKLFGKSLYGRILEQLKSYHALDANAYDAQMRVLIQIGALIDQWETKHGQTSQKNTGLLAWLPARKRQQKRRIVLARLKQRLVRERALVGRQQQLPALRRRLRRFKALPEFKPETFFAEKNVEKATKVKGGQMNPELQEVTYKHGKETQGSFTKQIPGGKFTGMFKYQLEKDPGFGKHRGTVTGIPQMNPKFMERSLATYKLDQLLGADVIAPTFAARLKGKKGYIQEKIPGKTGAQWSPKPHPLESVVGQDVNLDRALSKIYLLDIICAQVDRHNGNFIVTEDKEGKVTGAKAIDNDLAFGGKYNPSSTPGIGGGTSIGGHRIQETPVERAFAEKIIKLAGDSKLNKILSDALGGLLQQAEIDATVKRLIFLSKWLQQLLKRHPGKDLIYQG